MFIGHFAVAFAAKRAAPELSLGMLFIAAQLADLIWPTLVLAGVERLEIRQGITAVTPLDFVHYPYSHSLVAVVAWGTILGTAFYVVKKGHLLPPLVLAAVVMSHWVLDVVSHRPDMPVTLHGTARLGLGLWNNLTLTALVEVAMFAISVWSYVGTTRPSDRVGRWGLAALLIFLLSVYILTLLGPAPPNVAAVVWGAQAVWLLVAWAFWIDRHRTAR